MTMCLSRKTIQRYCIHDDDAAVIQDDGLDGRNYLAENLRKEVEYDGKCLVQLQPQEDVVFERHGIRTP